MGGEGGQQQREALARAPAQSPNDAAAYAARERVADAALRAATTITAFRLAQVRQLIVRKILFSRFDSLVRGAGVSDAFARLLSGKFYAAARELTKAHGTLLLVDSIQAGLRAHGTLSVVDYPGFEGLEAPDMETYSKALNGGQYPMSVLAVNERAAGLYRKGTYGNTMTANPRALDIAAAMLDALTPELRTNIRERGQEFLDKLGKLRDELGNGLITKVQGTGLLFSCELDPSFKCFGAGSTEEYMRERGMGVIHGGTNSLRFTPHFAVTSGEVDLVVAHIRHALLHGPRKSQAEAA